MPYKLVQSSPSSVDVTSGLESFFIFYKFNVDRGSRRIEIQKGYFAAYLSQKSGKPFIQSLYGDANAGKEDSYRKLEISNVAEQKISINNVRLVDSRFSQFSNEVSQLHLFDFSDEKKHKKNWIDTKGWSPKFRNPTANDDGKYFIEQKFSFDQVKDRYLYWVSSQANGNKTERIALCLPFISNSLITTFLSNYKEVLPQLQLTLDEKSWSYPPSNDEDLPGAVEGFLMVAEGAFKCVALNGEIDNLLQDITGEEKTSKDVIMALSKIVSRYPTSITRTLNTATRNDSNSIIPSTPELPIEVLYMEKLNNTEKTDNTDSVDMLLK